MIINGVAEHIAKAWVVTVKLLRLWRALLQAKDHDGQLNHACSSYRDVGCS